MSEYSNTAGTARETVQALKQQLAEKGAELERVKFQRDVQFEQETEMLSKMRLMASESRDWRARVIHESEELFHYEASQSARVERELETVLQREAIATRQAQRLAQLQAVNSHLVQSTEERYSHEAAALEAAQASQRQSHIDANEVKAEVAQLRRRCEEQPEHLRQYWARSVQQETEYKAKIHELQTQLRIQEDNARISRQLHEEELLETPHRSVSYAGHPTPSGPPVACSPPGLVPVQAVHLDKDVVPSASAIEFLDSSGNLSQYGTVQSSDQKVRVIDGNIVRPSKGIEESIYSYEF